MLFLATTRHRLIFLVVAFISFSTVGQCQRDRFITTGTITTFSVPGSTDTNVNGLNNVGQLVGEFISPTGDYGFMLDADTGVITTISYPGGLCTGATAINDVGSIIGFYCDTSASSQGFMLENGAYTQIAYPGAFSTVLYGMNNRGDIVGWYELTQNGQMHGFVLTDGVYSTFDVPGSSLTFLTGINYSRQIVGNYCVSQCSAGPGGFFFSDGIFEDVSYPGADVTQVSGINDRGQLFGLYAIGSNSPAFAYNTSTAKFFTFSLRGRPTTLSGINDSGGIAGTVNKHAGNFGFYRF